MKQLRHLKKSKSNVKLLTVSAKKFRKEILTERATPSWVPYWSTRC